MLDTSTRLQGLGLMRWLCTVLPGGMVSALSSSLSTWQPANPVCGVATRDVTCQHVTHSHKRALHPAAYPGVTPCHIPSQNRPPPATLGVEKLSHNPLVAYIDQFSSEWMEVGIYVDTLRTRTTAAIKLSFARLVCDIRNFVASRPASACHWLPT